MRHARILTAAAACLTLCALAAPSMAQTCARQDGDVAVGGLDPVQTIHSLASLAVPANTVKLRATCRARLYLHWVGWIVLSDQERAALAAAMTDQVGRVSLEWNFFSSAVTGAPVQPLATAPIDTPGISNSISNPVTSYVYPTFVRPWGIGPDEVHLNGFQDSCLSAAGNALQVADWEHVIDQYRATGVHTVSVVFSPNNWGTGACNVGGSFSDPQWSYVKAVAIYGGGLTLDPPPYFFLAQQPAYQAFTEQEIAWAKANHVKVTVIVSPPPDDTVVGNLFASQTAAMVARLVADGGRAQTYVPDAWVAENYDPFQDPADPNVLGSEDAPDSVTAVALWLAMHAPTTANPTVR